MKKMLLGAAAYLMVACGQPVLPTIDKVINVVQQDLEAGDTDAQIASDVCAALGGSATTDAVCANAPALISDAVTILLDSGLLSAKGQATARDYKTRHTAAAAPSAPTTPAPAAPASSSSK